MKGDEADSPSTELPVVLGQYGDFWAVYKPAGVKIHPANHDGVLDLVTWLKTSSGLPRGTAPAHRLDLETSGLVLCGATRSARGEIGRWLKEGSLSKTYLALVFGRTRRKGIIRRSLQDPRRRVSLDAVTRYKTREQLGGLLVG